MRSISKRNSNPVSTGCGVALVSIFGLLFLGVGVSFAVFTSGTALRNVYSAQHWQPARCEITFSGVTSSKNGKTSRINIQYRYVWNDRRYYGTRYDFTVGADNFNPAGKADIIARHRPGQTVDCFVNPDDPAQSVINREMKWGYLFGLGFGAPFTLVPLLMFGGMLYARRKAKQQEAATIVPATGASSASGASLAFAGAPIGAGSMGAGFTSGSAIAGPTAPGLAEFSGPVVLKPESSPIGRLIGMIVICLFWNGLTGVFTYFAYFGRSPTRGGWLLAAFLIPFQLIGLALIWAVIKSALALANPKPILTLSAGSVPVGGALTLQWQFSGASGRLRNVRITLNGREEVRYRRGTETKTDTHTFYETPVLETSDPNRIARGMATIAIPANTMHSFRAADNKIIWSLKVAGDIAAWPDVDETFDIAVRPR